MKASKYPPAIWHSLNLLMTRSERLAEEPARLLPVHVTLTSIGPRLRYCAIAVRSLLLLDPGPQQITLWLGNELTGQIPASLARLQCDRFRIAFREDVGPHTKLVHALREQPNETHVTADDDILYPTDWLAKLWPDHKANPNAIVANVCRRIWHNPDGSLKPYRHWHDARPGTVNENNLMLGYSGVLYPPGALPDETIDSDRFRQLAPKADDLWFAAMAMKNGTPVRRSEKPGRKPYRVPFSQGVSLRKTNVLRDGNEQQWAALQREYGFPNWVEPEY